MNKTTTRKFLQLLLASFFLLMGVKSFAIVNFSQVITFTAQMKGANEVPSVTSNARGVATISITPDKTTAVVDVTFTGLSGPATGIHIHEGKAGTNGGVVFPIHLSDSGNRAYSRIKISPTDLAKMIKGEYYINIHTSSNPNGEIRGQILLETDIAFVAPMDAKQAGKSNGAKGLATFVLGQDNALMKVDIVYTGLTDTPTDAHLHYGLPGKSGSAVVDLGALNGGFALNTIQVEIDLNDNSQVSDKTAFLDSLMNGRVYLNLHTKANPGGEIRGQVMMPKGLSFSSMMLGTNETPKVFSNAAGNAFFTLNPMMDSLSFYLVYDRLDGKAKGVHLHTAANGQNGPVHTDLMPYLKSGNEVSGVIKLDRKNKNYLTTINDFLTGKIYVNIHDSVDKNGKIRGQLYRYAHEAYYFDGAGGLVVVTLPQKRGTGFCGGMVSIDRTEKLAHYSMVVYNLTGTINKLSYNVGKPDKNGLDKRDATAELDNNYINGYWDAANKGFGSPIAKAFGSDSVYFQALTSTYTYGEVRANSVAAGKYIRDDLNFPSYSGIPIYTAHLDGMQQSPSVTTPARGFAAIQFTKSYDSLWISIAMDSLSDSITGAHLHYGKPGTNGGVVLDLSKYVQNNHISTKLGGIKINNKDSVASLMKGNYYINIHTKKNPNGEIRGNFMQEAARVFICDIASKNVLPNPNSGGTGNAEFLLSPDGKTLYYAIVVQRFNNNGTATSVVLKEKSATDTPGITKLVLSGPSKDGVINGKADISKMSLGFLDSLMRGETFIIVYTDIKKLPQGEAKGYILPSLSQDYDAILSADQEANGSVKITHGLATFSVAPKGNLVNFNITVSDISDVPTAVNICAGNPNTDGKILIDVKKSVTVLPNRVYGQISGKIMDSLFKYGLTEGKLYISLVTPAYPKGEVRGQIYPHYYNGYMFDLCASQVSGSATSKAHGLGVVTLNRNRTTAMYQVQAGNLSGTISSAHIHNGVQGSNGGVVYPLLAPGNFIMGNWMASDTANAFDTAMYHNMMNGKLYVNIHTSANPSGEIRGQIVNGALCKMTVGVDEKENTALQFSTYPVPVTDALHIQLKTDETTNATIQVFDLNSRILVTKQIKSSAGNTDHQVDFSTLPKGIYLVKIVTDKGGVSCQKIVKM